MFHFQNPSLQKKSLDVPFHLNMNAYDKDALEHCVTAFSLFWAYVGCWFAFQVTIQPFVNAISIPELPLWNHVLHFTAYYCILEDVLHIIALYCNFASLFWAYVGLRSKWQLRTQLPPLNYRFATLYCILPPWNGRCYHQYNLQFKIYYNLQFIACYCPGMGDVTTSTIYKIAQANVNLWKA